VKVFLKCAVLLALALTVWSCASVARTTGTGGSGINAGGTVNPKIETETKEFPLWVKDLRRADIIAFGSFPFTMFFTTFAIDTWRCADHGWDQKYAPWPFKGSGAIDMTTSEHEQNMIIAAAASVTLALTDYVIVRIKRHKLARKAQNMPAGSPIIINQFRLEEPAANPEASPAGAGSLP
jgi:hypothetical protein